jgi:hypothetical protein
MEADIVWSPPLRGPGLRWDAVDLDSGEIVIEAGRVLLDGHRTATEDPKSSASHRTVSVKEIQPGTVALLRCLRARHHAERFVWALGTRRPAWYS